MGKMTAIEFDSESGSDYSGESLSIVRKCLGKKAAKTEVERTTIRIHSNASEISEDNKKWCMTIKLSQIGDTIFIKKKLEDLKKTAGAEVKADSC
eukprot:gene21252-8045_t